MEIYNLLLISEDDEDTGDYTLKVFKTQEECFEFIAKTMFKYIKKSKRKASNGDDDTKLLKKYCNENGFKPEYINNKTLTRISRKMITDFSDEQFTWQIRMFEI